MLAGVVLFFCLLSASYSVVAPPFENPDEVEHARYAVFLADHRRLPRLLGDCVRMAFHPPLYHALLAPLAAATGVDYERVFLGYALNRDPSTPGVILAHGFPDERFPYADGPRFVHAARLLTILPGVVLLFFTWKLARVVLGGTGPPLVATALAASLPQLQYISASLNHDALAAAAGAGVAYASVLLFARPTARIAACAGLALSVGLLTKASSVALVPVPLLALALSPAGPVARRLRLALLVAVVPAVLAGWWYVEQWRELGSPFPTARLVRDTWVGFGLRRTEPFAGVDYWHFARNVYESFVFKAGLMHVAGPSVAYVVWLPFVAAALCGLARLARARRTLPLAVGVVCLTAALLSFNQSVSSPQGRYLFPVLPVLAVAATSAGLAAFRARFAVVAGGYVALLALTSLATLVGYAQVFAGIAPRPRPDVAGTARLFCDNEYRQPLEATGDVLSGLRLRARADGERDFVLRVALHRADEPEPVRAVELPGHALPSELAPVEVRFPPLPTQPGERLIVSFSTRDATPLAKPVLAYEPRTNGDGFSVDGAPQRGRLVIEEIAASSIPATPG
ncbi:MAG TPA: glycosyltransferase family 39 protein [Candidatus Binatia bacterium]